MVVVITNQKGGVGKSTTAEALACGLVRKSFRTLLVDLDPQCSITLTSGADAGKPTSFDVLVKTNSAQEATQQRTHEVTRADIIPASVMLSRLDLHLTATGKEHRLKEQLSPLYGSYDYIVVDTPPALGILTINALTAADTLIIPAQADVYSLQGIWQLTYTIDTIRAYTNPGLRIAGILLTRHNPRTILSRDMADVADATAKRIGTFLYTTVIRESVVIKEAQVNRQPIYDYAPKSNAAADYMAFTDEFLERSKHE